MARSLCLSLALLFLANVIPSKAQSEPPTTEAARQERAGDAVEVVYELRGNICLLCTLPNDNGQQYIWKKNATLVSERADLKERLKLEAEGAQLNVTKGVESDFGNYSCELPAGGRQLFAVRARPLAKLDANTNVVEGQELKIPCKVYGKPYQNVTWWYQNSSESNYTEVREALGDRVKLLPNEQGVPGALLVIKPAQRSDAGRYNCTPGDGHTDSTELRVKDMYAALWPFLGICAEVFILCAIILVYEKRRTKPELDDSDTDNHDQKKS